MGSKREEGSEQQPPTRHATRKRSDGAAHSKAEKRQRSNQRRLQALAKMNERIGSGMAGVGGVTGLSLTAGAQTSAGRHVIFSSSDEASDSEAPAATKKGAEPPSTPRNRVDAAEAGTIRRCLFDSSSEGEEEEEGEKGGVALAVKLQFEGKAGGRLFRLQQKTGADRRFQMDERFLDSSDADGEEGEGDFASEKARTLSLIESVVGSGRRAAHTQNTGLTIPRYDPMASNCAEMEQVPPEPLHEDKEEEEEEEEEERPEVSAERFFTVSSDLKGLFARGEGEGRGAFTFLAGAEVEGEDGEGVRGEGEGVGELTKTSNKPKWLEALVRPRPSPDIPAPEEATLRCADALPFFFHSNDPVLCNCLGHASFSRPRPLEELREGWSHRRAALKEEIRRRHKQATKQIRRRLRQH